MRVAGTWHLAPAPKSEQPTLQELASFLVELQAIEPHRGRVLVSVFDRVQGGAVQHGLEDFDSLLERRDVVARRRFPAVQVN